jgi:DNA-binding response OmpR family regulator
VTTRILIIEDESVLALGLRRLLVSHGFEIAGCLGSVKAALTVIDEVDCDIAVLDVNLRGESVIPVAEILRRRGRPIVFMSGYGRSDLPAVFADVPLFSKPFDPNELVAVLREMLTGRDVA